MKIAHLIMVHKNAAQVRRLLAALEHQDADCYIHVDGKAAMSEYESLADLPRVYFIKARFKANWASFRFVEAIVHSVGEILKSGRTYDFINLLSGQDYPIKPLAVIHSFFARNIGRSFLAVEPQGSPWWLGAIKRVEQYHSVYYNFKGQYQVQRIVNALLPKRRFPLAYDLYGSADGSWWTMSTECARYLVNFMEEHPEIGQFGRYTWGSDEFMIATILMNSPFKDSIVNENYRYIDWSAGGSNPKVLTIADAQALANSPKFFARKFDMEQSKEILEFADYLTHNSVPEELNANSKKSV